MPAAAAVDPESEARQHASSAEEPVPATAVLPEPEATRRLSGAEDVVVTKPAEKVHEVAALPEPDRLVLPDPIRPFSPVQVPSITLSPRSDSGVTLGTRVILSSPSSTMGVFNFGSGAKSPATLEPIDLEKPTKAPDLGNATSSVPPVAAPALPVSTAVVDNLDLEANPTPPHARNRLKRKIRKRSGSVITKARKLLLKKKILKLLFGKDVAEAIQPHLSTVASTGESAV